MLVLVTLRYHCLRATCHIPECLGRVGNMSDLKVVTFVMLFSIIIAKLHVQGIRFSVMVPHKHHSYAHKLFVYRRLVCCA